MIATMRRIDCAGAIHAPGRSPREPVRLAIAGDSLVALDPAASGTASLSRMLAMPVLVNAHDHARPVRASSFGAGGKPLELWLSYLALLPHADPYLSACASLGRSVLGGAGAVMVHHTRFRSFDAVPEEAAAIGRAARDIGVRIGFAVALRDINPLVYGPSERVLAALPDAARAAIGRRLANVPPGVAEQIRLVDAAAEAMGEGASVQYGPAGPQWCSRALLEAVATASAETGRRVHMHLLETRYQRDWADANHPNGLLPFLRDIGLLSPRLTLAHCTYARPEELAIIAESGATIAVNTSSNLQIRSGIAPVGEMIRQGCRVALGLDGLALDEDDDALREMRLANLLHRGWGFDEVIAPVQMLDMAVREGRASVTGSASGGRLAVGEPADLLLIDLDRLDADALLPHSDPTDLLLARGVKAHIAEMIVGGRTILAEGRLTGIDQAAAERELLDRFRREIGASADLAAALPHLEVALRRHFAEAPCC